MVVTLRERTACADALGGLLKGRAQQRTREIATATPQRTLGASRPAATHHSTTRG